MDCDAKADVVVLASMAAGHVAHARRENGGWSVQFRSARFRRAARGGTRPGELTSAADVVDERYREGRPERGLTLGEAVLWRRAPTGLQHRRTADPVSASDEYASNTRPRRRARQRAYSIATATAHVPGSRARDPRERSDGSWSMRRWRRSRRETTRSRLRRDPRSRSQGFGSFPTPTGVILVVD